VLDNVIAGKVMLSFFLCFALALLANGIIFVAERLYFLWRFCWAGIVLRLTSG